MPENEQTPAIRFAGFTDDWERRKAIGIFKATADKGYPDLPVLSATQDRGMILREETGINIAHDQKNEATYKRVLPGQFVIHLRSFQGGFAHSNAEGITSPAYTVLDFVETSSHCDWFWKYIFSSESFVKRLEAVTYGIRDGRSISYDDFSEMVFQFPGFDEQKSIGEAFVAFDALIALHQREHDKTVNIKNAMLEKMFPKEGEDKPEIRFAGFTGPWEQRQLGKLCDEFRSGDFIKAIDITQASGYPVYGGNGLRGFTKTYNHNGEFALIGRQGALCGNMQFTSGKAYFTEHAVAVRANNENETRFLFYLLGTMNLGQYSGQSAQPGLAVRNLIELKTLVPVKTEQCKISALFANLDHLITLHQRELEKLQNMKKALLEKMFV